MPLSRTAAAALLALACHAAATAQPAPPAKPAEPAAEAKKPAPEEKSWTTKHTVRIAGRDLAYTATAGTMLLKEEDGTPKVSVFYVAYTKEGEDPAKRPVTFSFNGGPGSSSVWLHLGLFGPKRVDLGPEGFARPDEARFVANEFSLLDVSDFVFIDPVTTGYTRAVPGVEDRQYHGVREDIEAVGEFVRLWTSRAERWASPKFLAGESYGTTRAAGLVDWLQDRHGMYFDGVLLISAVLNFQTGDFHFGNDLPFVTFLPTYAATAWYHRKLAPELQEAGLEAVVAEARAFAEGDYQVALAKGSRLTAEERAAIAAKLGRLTGLAADEILRRELRIHDGWFYGELRRDERLRVGRLDSRFTVRDAGAGEGFGSDPSYSAIQGPYTAALNDYLRRELDVEIDYPYEILTGRVWPWSYKEFQNRYVDVADNLRQAMRKNPALEVFVANGYYDVATPFFATEYTFGGMDYLGDLNARVKMAYYEAGHMMYVHRGELAQLRDDLVAFYRQVLAPR
jgi:carboxypeptidase C (cathepsin A)